MQSMPEPVLHHHLVACHECDLLQRLPSRAPAGRLCCARCGAVLHRHGRDMIELPLALALAGLVLFALSNLYPLLEFRLQGSSDTTYLLAGIAALYAQGMPILATVVLFTTVLAPALHLALLIYVYGALRLGRRPPGFARALRLIQAILPWSMLEIFLLGVIVAAVKLAAQASIVPGPAAWSLGLLVLVLAAAATQVHPHRLWERAG
jgi:paraquat-inducible protein A